MRTIRNKKAEKKDRQRKEKDERVKKTDEEKSKIRCSHYLKGKHRHGFSGRKPVDDIASCPYDHPKPCRRFLENGLGEGGCKYGRNCKFGLHLTMCQESLKTRICPNAKPGVRCDKGYHLSGTKSPVDNEVKEVNKNENDKRSYSEAAGSKEKSDKNKKESDFLAREVRREVGALLKPLSSLLQKLMKEI